MEDEDDDLPNGFADRMAAEIRAGARAMLHRESVRVVLFTNRSSSIGEACDPRRCLDEAKRWVDELNARGQRFHRIMVRYWNVDTDEWIDWDSGEVTYRSPYPALVFKVGPLS